MTVPVTGGMMGMAVGSRGSRTGGSRPIRVRLPLSLRERAAFAVAGVRLQHAVARYRRATAARPGDSPASPRARALAFEDHRTFGEFLGPLPPAVEAIFSCAAHRATASCTELSAGCGIGLFALVWSGRGSLIARNLLGGTGALPAALGDRLGARARTGCRGPRTRPEGDDIVVEHDTGAIRARHVIVAVPRRTRRRCRAGGGRRGGRAAADHVRRVPQRGGRDGRPRPDAWTTSSRHRRARAGVKTTCSPTRRRRCATAARGSSAGP